MHNPNCDGGDCRSIIGSVRVYPLGGGGNLILCRACWGAENRYRAMRAQETRNEEGWPQVSWEGAEEYPAEWISQEG